MNAGAKLLGAFDVMAIARSFPDAADTMLLDTRLTDEPAASARIFKVYRPIPAHYHEGCDEYLYMLSGRARFFMGDATPFEVCPGQLLFFKRRTVHGMPELLDQPVVFLSVDTPRRHPKDVVFVDPSAGTAETFIRDKEAAPP